MGANKASLVAFLCGLLVPGMGQIMLGRKKRGLCFFFPANILFISAVLVLAARIYRASQAIPAGSAERLAFIQKALWMDGPGMLLVLGIAYVVLLLVGAVDAFMLARKP